MIRTTQLWTTRHALSIHHALEWYGCFCSSEVNSEWKFLSEVSLPVFIILGVVSLVSFSLSSQISVFLTSSFSLSDQSDAGEWDQVCGSRACGTEVRQCPCAVPLRSTLQCLGEFALINLIYYFLPWLTNAENSRPLIKAQLFWQATDEPAEPCAQWLYKFSHCLSNEYHFVCLWLLKLMVYVRIPCNIISF